MWSPTSAKLIHGEHDAVLVEPLMTVAVVLPAVSRAQPSQRPRPARAGV